MYNELENLAKKLSQALINKALHFQFLKKIFRKTETKNYINNNVFGYKNK